MIQPWEVYAIFNALKLHFSSNYDAVKYQYKTNASKSSFLKRNDRYFFSKLGKKYNRIDLHNLILSNMVHSKGKIWVGDLMDSEAEEIFLEWRKRTESLRMTVSKDLKFLFNETESHCLRRFDLRSDREPSLSVKNDSDEVRKVLVNEFLSYILNIFENRTHPPIIESLIENSVSIETVIWRSKAQRKLRKIRWCISADRYKSNAVLFCMMVGILMTPL